MIVGDCNLIHGDCLTEMAGIADASIDMILCDLPYGTTACKWDTVIPFEPLWAHYKRIIKPRGAIVLTASQPFTSALVMSNPAEFRHEWIWDKVTARGFQIAKVRPMQQHESALVFSREPARYFPIMERMEKADEYRHASASDVSPLRHSDGKRRVRTHKFPKSILRFNGASWEKGRHPSQKPVALMEYLIRTYTNEGETVLDNTMGSGTTGVACVNTGRKFIGIERDATYFGVCVDRIRKAYADAPLLQGVA